jgi:uncharacterized protein (DUF427 family)
VVLLEDAKESMMQRSLISGLLGLLLAAGCAQPESPSAAETAVAQSSGVPESACASCAVDAATLDKAVGTVQAAYLDENNRLLRPGGPRWMPTPKRVRVYFGGELVADSRNVHLLRESAVPAYYFPEADVKSSLFVPSTLVRNSPIRGDASFWSIKSGDRVAEDAVWTYRNPVPGAEFLKGYVAFDWGKMDAWFEEDDQVFVHPRDPFLRIDTVHSSQHVKVILGSQIVAESDSAVIVLEPGQPIRYYLPIADTRVELLRPSQTTSRCPYKGLANYYSMVVGGKTYEDVIWSYRSATLESETIAGMVSFYNEQVDAILIDGKELPKPTSRRGGA